MDDREGWGESERKFEAYSRLPHFRSAASICWTDKVERRPGRDNTVFEADGEGKTFRVADLFSTRNHVAVDANMASNAGFGRKIISKLLACKSYTRFIMC